jgi:hypothetical protein
MYRGMVFRRCIAEWYSADVLRNGIPQMYCGMVFRRCIAEWYSADVLRNGIPQPEMPFRVTGCRICIAEWYSATRNTIPGYRVPHMYRGMVFRSPKCHSGLQGAAYVSRNGIPQPEMPFRVTGCRICIAEWYSAARNTIPGYRVPHMYRGMTLRSPEYHSGLQGAAYVSRNDITQPGIPFRVTGCGICIAEWYSAARNAIPGYRVPHMYRGMVFRSPEYHSGLQGAAYVSRNGIPQPEMPFRVTGCDICIAEWYSAARNAIPGYRVPHMYRGMVFRSPKCHSVEPPFEQRFTVLF